MCGSWLRGRSGEADGVAGWVLDRDDGMRDVEIVDECFIDGRFSIDFPVVSGHDGRHAIGRCFLLACIGSGREGTFDEL